MIILHSMTVNGAYRTAPAYSVIHEAPYVMI